jgi:ribosome-binding protein aMBF1 (putative translation factor)
MAKNQRAPTTDAVEILHRRYVQGRPRMRALVEEERVNARIAQAIYDLRQQLGLTQRQFAKRVGTSASVICRLEDANYQGHTTRLLERIASAANARLHLTLTFIPRKPRRQTRGKHKTRAAS